jgi:mannosyltransferase
MRRGTRDEGLGTRGPRQRSASDPRRASGASGPRPLFPSPYSLVPLLLLLLALGLRLYRLPAQSLSYDEAVSVYLARLPVGDMLSWTATDVQPPLYYLALRAWLPLAGASEFAVRYLSVLAATLAIAVFYRLGRDLAGRAVGVGAALAAALHPWYVWHAQDARMYSLLLLLCLLASWLLLLWWREQRAGGHVRPAVAVALPVTYAAAVYTHYLAAPLFAYHLLLVALSAARSRRWQTLRRYLLAVVAPAALLYLPWLPAVLATYRGDTSYYAGPVKLVEVAADAFTALFVGGVGETVFEPQGLRLALLLAVVLGVALGVSYRARGRRVAIALGALVVPALCSLALLAFAPKFTPRYLFPASLALPLLWGLTLAAGGRSAARAAALAALTALTVVSATVLRQTYANPAFTRADFRGAVAAVRAGLQPGERVVLSSGHLYPVWQYYAPEVPYVPLPDLRILSVERRVGLADLPALSRLLTGAPGVWLLRWQDDITDPMGIVPYALSASGAGEALSFWHVAVDHYHLAGPPAADPLAAAAAVGCDFGGRVRLLAADGGTAGRLGLFWQSEATPLPDLRATLTLTDGQGHRLARREIGLAGDLYTTSRWRPAETTLGSLVLPALPAVPAGGYAASLTVYDAATGVALDVLDSAGNPRGQSCPIGTAQIAGGMGATGDEALAAYGLQPAAAEWPGVALLGTGACPSGDLPPGAAVSLPLLWRLDGADGGEELSAYLASGGSAAPSAPVSVATVGRGYAAQLGDLLLSWLDLTVPAATPPGRADLMLGPAGGEAVSLCSLSVAAVPRTYDLPQVQYPADAEVGGFARLLGVDLASASLAPGGTVGINVYWQATATAEANYTAFVHLLGPDGRAWAQSNAQPIGGQRPTAGWLPGEVIADGVSLTLPADAPAGDYRVEVGFFDAAPPDMRRLAATEGGVRLPDDAVRLGSLAVR